MLTGLGHRTVGSGNYEDGTVHLSSTCYHVLHIVSVTRAVNVCIVTCLCLIFDMSGVNGNTTLLLLGCVVDRVERADFRKSFFSQYLGDGCGKSSFTVVNMADSTYVNMRLVPFESFFCHNVRFNLMYIIN